MLVVDALSASRFPRPPPPHHPPPLPLLLPFPLALPPWLQKSFAVTSSMASILTGVAVIPSAATGTVLGGYLVKRFKMGDAAIARMCTLFSATSCVTITFLLVRCNTPELMGVNRGYGVGVPAAPCPHSPPTPCARSVYRKAECASAGVCHPCSHAVRCVSCKACRQPEGRASPATCVAHILAVAQDPCPWPP